jgi:toxin YhaV
MLTVAPSSAPLPWVNDESTKRAYESSDDACRVFRKMLESGHPPDDWDQLYRESALQRDRLANSATGAANLI